tara:strand:+ start:5028 stop:5333 length:306 start_codon:yes stop_codon:yes gene_type:complete
LTGLLVNSPACCHRNTGTAGLRRNGLPAQSCWPCPEALKAALRFPRQQEEADAMTQTKKPNVKPTYKPYRSRRDNLALYVGGAAFLLGYLFGSGILVFSIG